MRSCRFVRSALLAASVILLGTAPFAARQAPAAANAGGTLIVQDLHLTVSATNTAVCLEAQPPASCEQADSRIDGALSSDPALFMVYAAFPDQGAPRLLGVTWGVEYDPGLIVSDHGRCGDFELDDPAWPASGAGSSVTWNEARTSTLVAVYWFAAYPATPGASASFAAVAHHDLGGTFGDDSVPALLDVIAGYGTLGFGQEGAISCPPGLAGACCDPQAITCAQEDALECASHGGLYVGPAVPCDPGTCATSGACCDIEHGGLCLEDMSAAACADSIHGYFGGVGSRCEDLSCVDYGACCRGTTCTLTTLGECEPSGVYAGFLTWCSPLEPPCAEPLGACCVGSDCTVLTEAGCGEGIWLEGQGCSSRPCSVPLGSCCTGALCEIVTSDQCPENSLWIQGQPCPPLFCTPDLGACCRGGPSGCSITTEAECDPDVWLPCLDCRSGPCETAVPARVYPGACCLPDDTCRLLPRDDCEAGEGVYLGTCVTCSVELCQEVPVQRTSWGSIKNRYKDPTR